MRGAGPSDLCKIYRDLKYLPEAYELGSGQESKSPQIPHSSLRGSSSLPTGQISEAMEGSISLSEGTDVPPRVNFVTGSLESESLIGAHVV